MATLTVSDEEALAPLPDVNTYKAMVAKGIIFKATQKLVRPMFQAFQANVTAYVISVFSYLLGERTNLDRIWTRQAVSPEMLAQLATWAREVNDELHRSAGGKMVSEWAKRPECKLAILGASYSPAAANIPECA
jgi:hypothetical protein